MRAFRDTAANVGQSMSEKKKNNKICEKSFRKEENMLSISNFTKSYHGKKNAVTNLSFEVRGGDIFGFIGHNGAGKTTTIKACAGILEFDEGTIKIDGTDIKKDPLTCKKRLRICLIIRIFTSLCPV